MPVFYYLEGKEKRGPYSIDELQTKPVTADSFIWYDRLQGWTRLEDVPEVYRYFKNQPNTASLLTMAEKIAPPPIDQISTALPKAPAIATLQKKATGNFAKQLFDEYRFAIYWCLSHVVILLLAYKEVYFFNNTGTPRTDKFWPFVKFTDPYFMPDDVKTYSKFNGFFTQYDWTEFSFYTGLAFFIILLSLAYRKTK
jgi:hypothetical protein